jgi:EAL domain-containing protein (putative c-di-GMP-specific phosphodiesterase class I)
MIGLTIKKVKSIMQCGKLLLPLHRIKYYPPRFVIREPIIEGVNQAFKRGHEVAVVAYHLKNVLELSEQFGRFGMEKFFYTLRKTFRQIIEQELEKGDLLLLDHNYAEVSLYIQVDHDRHHVSDIENIMKKVLKETEQLLFLEFPAVNPQFEKGYMFIEKRHASVQEAIYKASQQALAMAEKRVQTEYNEMLYSIRQIIAQKNIRLLGQPIIDLTTKEIKAWEMLSRGPEGTNLESPLRLFSVARQTGTLFNLEMIVLEKVFEKVTETGCRQEVFVNCTPLSLGNKQFVSGVTKLLDTYRTIDPKKLTIEITEQDSIEDMSSVNQNIRELRSLGFRIALDDTGAGYSSLNSISEILPDIIKIDRAVIQNIDKDTVKESMLKGLLLIAKETGSLVVAEGIENAEEALVLSRNQVDFAQGYYYARPAVFNQHLLSS